MASDFYLLTQLLEACVFDWKRDRRHCEVLLSASFEFISTYENKNETSCLLKRKRGEI